MQRRIIDIAAVALRPINTSLWTAIVPAAGGGSRLGYPRPKLLFPLLGRPILDWLIDALTPVCGHFVFVLSPNGRPVVEPELARRLGDTFTTVEQTHPLGMGDAVLKAQPMVRTPFTLVIWGDQATMQSGTVKACAVVHDMRPNAALTLPTVVKDAPYTHFERDAQDRILAVHQAREGDLVKDRGENDCGLFLFSSEALFRVLAAKRNEATGAATGEFNLLQVLPFFETGPDSVATVRVHDPAETIGINTLEEARIVEGILRTRQATEEGAPGAESGPRRMRS